MTTMTGEFLLSDDVQHLTGKKYKRRQIDALIAMGISFHVRPDGMPIVPKSQFRDQRSEEQEHEPNWEYLRAKKTEIRKPQTS